MSTLAFPRLRVPWLTLLLAAVIAAIFAASEASIGFAVHFVARSMAVKGLTASEPERLFASALIHSSPSHLYWNLAGLLLAGGLVESALGRAVFLNVALWGGVCGTLAGLRALRPTETAGGASGMMFALAGAFLTWRALRPDAFGSYQRNPILWVLLLLWTTASLATHNVVVGQLHFGGFAYGVGWGLLGPRFPQRWRRFFAALAVGLLLASVAALVVRALQREPEEVTRAMRVLYVGPQPASDLNSLSWYWATQADAPRAVLEMARDGMKAVVQKSKKSAYQDTLATLYYRLGELEQAAETERALLETEPRAEKHSFYLSQLARFEYARLPPDDARSRSAAPLRLRRAEAGSFRLEPATDPPLPAPQRALVLSRGRLVGYLERAAGPLAQAERVPVPVAGEGPGDETFDVVPLAADGDDSLRPTRLWWLDPAVLRLP